MPDTKENKPKPQPQKPKGADNIGQAMGNAGGGKPFKPGQTWSSG